jgi:hypothetical protein
VPIAERFDMDAGAVLDNVSTLQPDLFLVNSYSSKSVSWREISKLCISRSTVKRKRNVNNNCFIMWSS